MTFESVINHRDGKARLQVTFNVPLADSLEHHAGQDKANHAAAYQLIAKELVAHGGKLAKEAAEIFDAEKKAADAKAAAELKAKQ